MCHADFASNLWRAALGELETQFCEFESETIQTRNSEYSEAIH